MDNLDAKKEAKPILNSEKLSDKITSVTRSILDRGLHNPMFILTMSAHGIYPEDIELIVKDILEYLDKTKGICQRLLEEEEAED